MEAPPDILVPLRAHSGAVVAEVSLVAVREDANVATAPLIKLSDDEAREYGEATVQLRESERYEYTVVQRVGEDFRLRCSLATRRRSLGPGGTKADEGLIETRSYCGTLLLELVDGPATAEKTAVATALVEVRSLKLDDRSEYRGMLKGLAKRMAGLVADARASTKVGFRSTFEERTDAGWLQIHLELLRETLDSAEFGAALQRILSFPHERLSTVSDVVGTDRPIRWTPAAVRQLFIGQPRRALPEGHPLRVDYGVESVAARVRVPRRARDRDTLENRFVKFALGEFRAFLTHAQGVFEAQSAEWQVAAGLARRLAATVEDWLGRGLFREVGELRFAPLGSPVLQRKAGYREVLRWWLQFRTAAELSWEGGEAVFRAGQRDVASLYEYWLFFELLDWFCRTCGDGKQPPIEELVDGLAEGVPNLRLRKQMELGPFVGTFAGQSRRLHARFSYNRRFEVTKERHESGSWSRRLHPDYTLTFWPEGLSEADAEHKELLVHVHFDAKYRVENINGLFGAKDADDADQEDEGNYKRQDLLKMHAYRDAIKRSQGAYVLYPGRAHAAERLQGFHEILPGLGAFGVAPDENGDAQGLERLVGFLNEVLVHLGNRTTAQERVSYHIAESYLLEEAPVAYGPVALAEQDEMSDTTRALPPAEHHVVVAWFDSPAQLAWTLDTGIANVRLGKRRGAWHIPPEIASARHLLLRSRGGEVEPGLFRLTKPGYKVYTASDLLATDYPGAARGEIYAVFEIEPDHTYTGRTWDEAEVTQRILAFESRRKYRQIDSLGRRSADPRVLSLKELLRAMR